MFSFLTPYLFWLKLAGLVIGLGAAAAGGAWFEATLKDKTIADLKLQQSQSQTKSVQASLDQLTGFISKMNVADAQYQGALASIDQKFSAVQAEWKNATAKPLPVDCKPDALRLRVLATAVAATHQAASPGR
jgi:hypothetical protein